MKRLLFAFIMFVTMFLSEVSAQVSRTIFVDFGTVANSVTEAQYIKLDGWSKIDSISIALAAKGEIDVDSFDVYVGNTPTGVNAENGFYGSTAYTFTSTINLDSAATTNLVLLTSDATLLTGKVLRGINSLKLVTRGATSGCDPADTGQKLWAIVQVWGTK